MAELHIQRKRSIWPWVVLGLIILAILIWLFAGRAWFDEPDVVTTPPPVTTAPVAPAVPPPATTVVTPSTPAGAPQAMLESGPVADYLRYVEKAQANAVGLDHVYTANGLRQLADALVALARGDEAGRVDVEQKAQALRQSADAIRDEKMAASHANQVRGAMLAATNLLESIQKGRYPALEQQVAQVREAATSMKGDAPLTDQAANVQRFFAQSAAAVRAMATA